MSLVSQLLGVIYGFPKLQLYDAHGALKLLPRPTVLFPVQGLLTSGPDRRENFRGIRGHVKVAA